MKYFEKLIKNKSSIIFSFLIIFFGCSTMQTLNVSDRQHTFNAPYMKVFRAALNYCSEESFAVLLADKELGIINTDYKEAAVTEIFFGKSRAKINFTIKKIDSTETNIILIVSAEEQGDYGNWSQMTLTEGQAKDYYQKIFEGIESKL
jgi:hypothetical protein